MSLWTNVDEAAGKPQYLTSADKAKTFGVDVAEQAAETSQGVGPTHAGWVLRNTYTDQHGNTRTKLETLVAMGSISSDLEDTVMQDLNILITTQPVADSVTGPADLNFSVVASTAPTGGTLSYQWQVSTDDGDTWANMVGGVGATTDALQITSSDPEYVDGNQFRVLVSATGATTVTSDAALGTIA